MVLEDEAFPDGFKELGMLVLSKLRLNDLSLLVDLHEAIRIKILNGTQE
jgi:hypothetical protein